MLKIITQGQPRASSYHLVNDRYDIPMTIKDCEHVNRSPVYVGGSQNGFSSHNGRVPSTQKFSSFFVNADNKIRLQEFLRKELSELVKSRDQAFLYTSKEKCFCLKISTENSEYTCYHHEADTRLFLHASILDKKTVASRIIVDSEDTDVVALVAKLAHKISKELCMYIRGHNYDCKSLCSPEVTFCCLTSACPDLSRCSEWLL